MKFEVIDKVRSVENLIPANDYIIAIDEETANALRQLLGRTSGEFYDLYRNLSNELIRNGAGEPLNNISVCSAGDSTYFAFSRK